MSQEGNDLFEIMDSALKRQREAGGGHPKSESRRQSAAAAADHGAPAAGATISPAPGSVGQPSFPAEPPATRSTITQRFNQLPDMAKTAPAPGSLSPSQVLRGTVFSGGNIVRTAAGATAPAAPPAAAQPAQQPAAPPPSPPPPTARPGPARMSGVQQLAAGVVKTGRPSGVVGALRPSVALPEPVAPPPPPPPAAPASGTYRTVSGFHAPVAQPSTQGFFVRTPWAVTAVIAVTLGLVAAFWMGYRAGRSKARIGSGAPVISKPPVAGPGVKAIDLEGPPRAPIAGLPPSLAPKYTVQLKNYWPVDRAVAERLAAALRARGGDYADARVIVITRGAPGSETLAVCAGHFTLRTQAEAFRQATLKLPEQFRRDPIVIQE
jgi:hypothetical protein